MAQDTVKTDRPELVFALVGAVGTRLDDLSRALREQLAVFKYECTEIRLSGLLSRFAWKDQQGTGKFHQIRHLQDKGDAFREQLGDGAALVRAAIAEIRTERARISGNPDGPAPARAYILHQLKHPDEVDLLRQVYGSSFHLVAGHAPDKTRLDKQMLDIGRGEYRRGLQMEIEAQAKEVMKADEQQHGYYGQNTRDTYPKADFFADLEKDRGGEHAVGRFVALLFGHPFKTPTPDEYAMYLASAASLRSSDDNRQVGAVIVRHSMYDKAENSEAKNLDIIAVGMNEVPRAGGGFYWGEGSPDKRDQAVLYNDREDRAREIKLNVLTELIAWLREKGWLKEGVLSSRNEIICNLPDLKGTQFWDIGEFSRPVHAEMAALLDSARRGVAVDGQTMYVTTFPCHNCAKHIIAAGLRRVVYLEPYPKSRAGELHKEEIELDPQHGATVAGKVVFSAFTGVGPRQYQTLFSMWLRGAKRGRSLRDWNDDPQTLSPFYVHRNAALLYVAEERQELEKLPADVYQWDKAAVCPNPVAPGSESKR